MLSILRFLQYWSGTWYLRAYPRFLSVSLFPPMRLRDSGLWWGDHVVARGQHWGNFQAQFHTNSLSTISHLSRYWTDNELILNLSPLGERGTPCPRPCRVYSIPRVTRIVTTIQPRTAVHFAWPRVHLGLRCCVNPDGFLWINSAHPIYCWGFSSPKLTASSTGSPKRSVLSATMIGLNTKRNLKVRLS